MRVYNHAHDPHDESRERALREADALQTLASRLEEASSRSNAIISGCGTYRYRLEREWSPDRGTVAFIMVNPSTADAEQDDATIRKVRGFAQRHGYSRLIVGNLFAYRATDIRALKGISFGEAVGPDNNFHLHQIIGDADRVIVAWGPVAKVPKAFRNRWQQIVNLANGWGKPLYCLGTANDGHPRHPLMLAYDTPLLPWSGPAKALRSQGEQNHE